MEQQLLTVSDSSAVQTPGQLYTNYFGLHCSAVQNIEHHGTTQHCTRVAKSGSKIVMTFFSSLFNILLSINLMRFAQSLTFF